VKTATTYRVEQEYPRGSGNWYHHRGPGFDECEDLSQVLAKVERHCAGVVEASSIRIIEVKTTERIVHGVGAIRG
jgi:hypothetical protein